MEQWKDIKGYEGLYQVSDMGRVRSVDRIDSENHFRKGSIMAFNYHRGYCRVGLRNGKGQKMFQVHRLVAIHFIPNPDGLPQVNHRDENKTNNCISNLEWCSAEYNINYGNRNQKVADKLTGRPKDYGWVQVNQLDKEGCYIRTYDSITEAANNLGIADTTISACCRGKQKTAGGYIWKYADSNHLT